MPWLASRSTAAASSRTGTQMLRPSVPGTSMPCSASRRTTSAAPAGVLGARRGDCGRGTRRRASSPAAPAGAAGSSTPGRWRGVPHGREQRLRAAQRGEPQVGSVRLAEAADVQHLVGDPRAEADRGDGEMRPLESSSTTSSRGRAAARPGGAPRVGDIDTPVGFWPRGWRTTAAGRLGERVPRRGRGRAPSRRAARRRRRRRGPRAGRAGAGSRGSRRARGRPAQQRPRDEVERVHGAVDDERAPRRHTASPRQQLGAQLVEHRVVEVAARASPASVSADRTGTSAGSRALSGMPVDRSRADGGLVAQRPACSARRRGRVGGDRRAAAPVRADRARPGEQLPGRAHGRRRHHQLLGHPADRRQLVAGGRGRRRGSPGHRLREPLGGRGVEALLEGGDDGAHVRNIAIDALCGCDVARSVDGMTTPAVTTIDHWISGARVPGTSGRTAPVHDPATGRQTGEVPLASRRRGRRRRQDRGRRGPRLAHELALAGGPPCSSPSASCSTRAPTSSPRSSPPSTARCSRTPSARSPAASRTSSSPTGVPQLLKGGFSEQAASGVDVYSIRQPLGVVAGITPFNFPVMVPLWMCANAIACGNAFVLKPSEKDPSAVALPRRSCGRRPACPTASSPSSTATRRPSTRCSTTTTSPPSASSARRRSRSTSTSAARRTASGSRPSAAPRTTRSCCPTPTSTWPPTPSSRRPTARPASGAWRSRSRSRSATSATTLVAGDLRPAAQAHRRRRRRPGHRHGPAHHRASTATRSPATSPPGAEAGATVVVDGREQRRPGRRLLPRHDPARRRHARHDRLPRRDLRAGALASSGSTPTTRGWP